MSTNIVQLLKTERLRLQKHLGAIDAAISALNGDGVSGRVSRRRKMSAEARAKISAAAKKRWAKLRSGKN